MAANYNRPKPIDPVWYRQGCFLNIQCVCGRRESVELGTFARRHRIPLDTQLYRLISRLRCRQCGARPSADVTRHRGGN